MTQLMVAIDTGDIAEAGRLVRLLAPHVPMLKFGLQLFTAVGPRGVELLGLGWRRNMIDLKLHDTPSTVAGAVTSLLPLRPSMITIHASGGYPMITAAKEAVGMKLDRPLIIAVTVLTSLNWMNALQLGSGYPSLQHQVDALAQIAVSSGADGLVCSAWEARTIKRRYPAAQLIVPGIRPPDTPRDDQRRTATPREAADAGADWIVVGRPITKVDDPVEAAQRIMGEIT